MPRARNIKHSFFTNDELAEIEPLGRLLFIGLWTIADYKGDLEWRPKKVKAEILPYDNCDIEKLAINLDKSGFIRFYSDGDLTYLRITNFSLHQNPHKNEKDKGSAIPGYSGGMRQAVDLKGLTINHDTIESNPDENGSAPADSLSLIPDSLNPDSCSLNPDTGTLKETMSSKLGVISILDYLNLKTGKKFKPTESNLKLIRARLNEGHTTSEILGVVDLKTKEWANDDRNQMYLRPATLFGALKFNQYVGELGVETPEQKRAKEVDDWCSGGGDVIEGEKDD